MQIYGIDLAMKKFDVHYFDHNNNEKHLVVSNNLKAITKFLNNLPGNVMLCAEHTGVYGNLLVFLSNQQNIPISLISGYEIKHSLGLTRGKSDKIDAKKIYEYGIRFNDRLKPFVYEHASLQELKELYILRKQLVKERKMLETHQQAKKHVPYNSISAHNHARTVIESLNVSIKGIEAELLEIIEAEPELKQNYDLATSVKGIGKVTACDLIIKTGNFKIINTARKASSYAGVCPFPNESGTMVRKSRVSSMGDKSLKALLCLCAKSAILYNKEYRLYFQKKQLEGKPYYLILNNVSNKLLRTIYSVIESKKPYDPEYFCTDPRFRKKVA